MNAYRPADELGRHLIQSIPHKIFEWLASSGVDPDAIEQIGKIVWASDLEGGSLTFEGTTIDWTGHASQPGITRGSDPMFENLSANLKQFVDFEKQVYAEVEAYVSTLPKHE